MKTAVIIPCYKVRQKVLAVLAGIGPEVQKIFCVDDACPEKSGLFIKENGKDPRVEVIFLPQNQGVGGAVLEGWKKAAAQGYQIAVKLDGDGQMNPKLIPALVRPLQLGQADFVKGNRFFLPRQLSSMPKLRLLGNTVLSFWVKLTSGYWQVMDPTNGFLAIRTELLPLVEPHRLAKRYFFEIDLLFRLGLIGAVVRDMPMVAHYSDEKSNLSEMHSALTFPPKLFARTFKRIAYRYFIRDFSAGSVLILAGLPTFLFGLCFGLYHWIASVQLGTVATSGTVMLAALPTLMGFQLLAMAIMFDVNATPSEPLAPLLPPASSEEANEE
jgi:dolichol-phosphate mannosyltransferase